MSTHNVIIIGAGPAGSSAAKILEDNGHEVLLLDREEFPRNKPCAGVLSPKIFSLVDEIPESVIERPLDGYRVFAPSGKVAESLFPEPGAIVRRDRFDDHLVGKLDKGPAQALVTGIVDKGSHLEVKGGDWSLEAEYVIGADGANSIVKKHCGAADKSVAVAAQYELKLPANEVQERVGNWFEVYYVLEYGYGWISPMKDGLKVGVGILKDHLKGSIMDTLDAFTKMPIVREKVIGALIEGQEGHPIPMSGPLDRLSGNRALLVGDAGGFVYPGTGEGVYYAIKTGRIAAEVISRVLAGEDSDLDTIYTEELEKAGMLALRDVNFVEKNLSGLDNAEKYVKRLRFLESTT